MSDKVRRINAELLDAKDVLRRAQRKVAVLREKARQACERCPGCGTKWSGTPGECTVCLREEDR